MKDREPRGVETPRPEPIARVLVSGFIRADERFLNQGLAKLGIGLGEGGRGFCTTLTTCERLIGIPSTSFQNRWIVLHDI